VPVRNQNIVKLEVPKCLVQRALCEGKVKAAIYINFADAKRREDGVDMLMSCCVISIMVGLTSNLTSTINRLVVLPLERMLTMVREVSSTILKLTEDEDIAPNDDEDDDTAPDETELLERVFDKLSRISSIALQDMVVDTHDMSDEARGIVVDMMNMKDKHDLAGRNRKSVHATGSPDQLFAKLAVPVSAVDSWTLDLLKLAADDREQVVIHILFDSGLGTISGSNYSDLETFKPFYDAAMAGYMDQPYHNAVHAADVMHCVYRLLTLTKAEQWVSSAEIFAMLIAALCHDMGHVGRTNPFLVETGHDLALQYNDASPLENMHCSSLFKLCTNESMNVFKDMSSDQYKKARRVAVAAILHTDNANHFDMVKNINKAYEVASELIEKQASLGEDCDNGLYPQYVTDVLRKDSLMFLELFLHFADISNPLKPFDICQAWAARVLDEFFDQGDEEKRLGIPVGMLNDRDKVNRPGSQHGFINFLVAPLVFGAVKLFPMLHPLATQMANNVQEWRNIWVTEASPDEEAVQKRDVDVEKILNAADELRRRVDVGSQEGHGRRVHPSSW